MGKHMAESAPRTSLSILQGARVGDAICWRRLDALYGPLIYQWCRSAHWSEHDAADLVQEVFEAVHRKLPEFTHNRAGATFRGWLRTIVANKMRDRWRQLKRQTRASGGSEMLHRLKEIPDVEPPPTIHVDSDTNRMEINWLYHRALEMVREEFDSRTWRAFWQVVVEDRAPADVAADLGTSRNSVYIAKSRVLSRLRAEFAEVIEQ